MALEREVKEGGASGGEFHRPRQLALDENYITHHHVLEGGELEVLPEKEGESVSV